MHIRIEDDAIQELPPVSLQGTAVVADGNTGEPTNDPIGNPGGNLAGEQPVLSPLPIPHNQIITLSYLGHETGNVGRIVLEIPIHGHHDVPTSVVEPSLHGRRLTVVAGEADHTDAVVLGSQTLGDLGGAVRTAVVHQDQFPGVPLQRIGHTPNQAWDALLLVKERSYYRD